MVADYNCPICNRELRYEGLCWECRAEKEREEAMNLTWEEVRERQAYLAEHVQELGDRKNPADKYFWDCLTYHDIIAVEVQRAAVQAQIYHPQEIYYHAPEDVRDVLIEQLMMTEDSMVANNLMGCLAMQGDDKALQTLYELKKNPKEWRKKLYADPDVYAYSGGWTFDEHGKRIEINYSKCYSFDKVKTVNNAELIGKENISDKAVTIGKVREDKCPHCGSGLIDMVTLDGRDERLSFLGVDGKITATCCPSCVMFTSPVYGRFDLDGTSEAVFPYLGLDNAEEIYISEEDFTDDKVNNLELSKVERPIFYGAEDWEIATVGGFAHWIQDCNIAPCPDCGKPMKYLAQFPYQTITKAASEGILYFGICPDCRTVSVQYQQT